MDGEVNINEDWICPASAPLRQVWRLPKNGGFLAHRNHQGWRSAGNPETQNVLRADREGHPPSDPQTIFSQKENPHSADGLRGERSIAELCRREDIAGTCVTPDRRSSWRPANGGLASDAARAATSGRQGAPPEARALKEVVAEQALELRLLKKSMIADGDTEE